MPLHARLRHGDQIDTDGPVRIRIVRRGGGKGGLVAILTAPSDVRLRHRPARPGRERRRLKAAGGRRR